MPLFIRDSAPSPARSDDTNPFDPLDPEHYCLQCRARSDPTRFVPDVVDLYDVLLDVRRLVDNLIELSEERPRGRY